MSISSVNVILERAKAATVRSPLVVFVESDCTLDCVFGDSIITRARMKNPWHSVAMVIDGSQHERDIRKTLIPLVR